jgi:outer membrane receptor protein involved in Fe transport
MAVRGSDEATRIPTTAPDGKVVQAQVPELPPSLGEQPTPTPATMAAAPAAPSAPTLGGPGASMPGRAEGTGASVITQGESFTRPSGDIGDLLGKSQSATGVEVQRRSPIVTDPRIRGYQVGQIYTQLDSAYFIPSRRDLDSIVSKIDSSLIRDAIIIRGPFSVRYGPAFAFIDVETLGARRYENGWEAHGATSLIYKTNGDQWKGRQDFWGGDKDWGFRLGYELASGGNYEIGDGDRLPSSYNTQNINFAVAYWLSKDSHVEFNAFRVDQHSVDLPGQVFDVTRLITDAYDVRYVCENQELFDRFTVDAWWNETRLNGDNTSPSKRAFIPQLNATFIDDFGQTQQGLGFVGFTDADALSTGYRAAVTWGKEKCPQATIGVDLRYLSQKQNEFDIPSNLLTSNFTAGNFPIPRSHWTDPGLFLDTVLPLSDSLLVRGGTRFDWTTTAIDQFPTSTTTAPPGSQGIAVSFPGPGNYERNFAMWAGFLSGEYKLNSNLTALGNFGIAQRPPTLTELYAMGPFISILQNGLNSVLGNPNLTPEQVWQLDIALKADYGKFRGGVNGFYAWIHDYITLETLGPSLPAPPGSPPTVEAFFSRTGGINVRFVNTELATLAGAELYGEYDVTDWLTPFATLTYVEGRDHTRDHRGNPSTGFPTTDPEEPLPGIAPLEARLGLRVHEARTNPRWAVEFTARVVDEQDRFAESLGEVGTPGFLVFDLRSYWQVNKNLLLTAGVENLGDKNYQEHLDLRTGTGALGRFGVFQPGTNFYFGARLEY